MYCRICGDENGAEWRDKSLQALCASCAVDTPAKVGRRAFDAAMWKGEDVGESVAREFYTDYLASSYTLERYIATR